MNQLKELRKQHGYIQHRKNANSHTINECDLYVLIFVSQFDSAKRFKRWVISENLPQILPNKGGIIMETNESLKKRQHKIRKK